MRRADKILDTVRPAPDAVGGVTTRDGERVWKDEDGRLGYTIGFASRILRHGVTGDELVDVLGDPDDDAR
jgi:hypothetical protein